MPFDTFVQDTIIIDCDKRGEDTRIGGVVGRFKLQFLFSIFMVLIVPSAYCIEHEIMEEISDGYSQGNSKCSK